MVSGGDINGLTHADQPRRRALEASVCELRFGPLFHESDKRRYTLWSAVTVTVQAEAVGLRIKRLSHHRMIYGNV